MSEAIINPRRERGEPRLPATGLLLINPAEAAQAAALAAQHQGRRHFLFNSNLYLVPEAADRQPLFVAGPAVGAPMAVMTLEKLVALGGRRFIVYGWCGAINSSLQVGDVLLATWAISGEGTSAHYGAGKGSQPAASENLRVILGAALRQQGVAPVAGPVWTTDAPYRETRAEVEALSEQGILAVDMEFSALGTVAAYRGVELAAVMLVSDELWQKPWQAGFRNRGFREKGKKILRLLFELCSLAP